jgi:hypothetical protein
MKRVVVLLAVAAFAAACDDQSQTLTPPGAPLADVMDGANDGNPEFFFLPPLVPTPTLPLNFDPMAWPTVEICPYNGGDPLCGDDAVARFTRDNLIDQSSTHFHVDWDTSGEDEGKYRIFVLFGSTEPGEIVLRELGYRDVEIGGKGKARSRFKGISPGSKEQIKFWIGTNAGCYEGSSLINDCVLGTVTGDGATLLTGGGEAVFIANAGQLPSGETVALKLELVTGGECIGFDDGTEFTSIDLAQYPDCYKVTTFPSDAGFTGLQTFGICLDHAGKMIDDLVVATPYTQVESARLYRMSDDRSTVHVMDLVLDVIAPCPDAELTSLGNPFVNFARNTLERLGLPIAPPPLVANALTVRHEGLGGRGEASTLGFGMPASLLHYGGVTDLGTWPLGTELAVKAVVEDVTGFPVMGSTVWFQPEDADLFNGSAGPVSVVTTGVVGDENNNNSDVNGVASGVWTLKTPGDRELTAYGVGYATPPVTGDADDGLDERDNVSPVPFEIVFKVTVTVPLVFYPDPPNGDIYIDAESGVATLGNFSVCTDPATAGVEITSLVAVKNNGDPVELTNLPPKSWITLGDGCFPFWDSETEIGAQINKTGAYRLVANGDFESRKFNVRPPRKNN